MLEKLKNIIIVAFTLSLVASYFMISGYYSSFNVDITSFLKIEDLILIYSQWVWLILLIFGFILYPMYSLFIKDINEDGWWDQTFITYKKINYKRRAAIILPSVILIILSSFWYQIIWDTLTIGTAVLFLISIIASAIYIFYSKSYKAKDLKDISPKDWAGLLIFSLFLIWVLPFIGSIIIAKKLPQENIVVVLENDTINTQKSQNLKYIGKTSDYFFVNDTLTKATTAYRMDKVKSFEMIPKKN